MPRYAARSTVLGVLLTLASGTVAILPARADEGGRPEVQHSGDPVRGEEAGAAPGAGKDPAAEAAVTRLAPSAWPEAGSVELALAPRSSDPLLAPLAPRLPGAETAGDLPVAVAPLPGAPIAAARRAGSGPARVRVTTPGEQAARAWGSAALLAVDRADGSRADAPVELAVDYSAFAEAYGGSYGSRLRLVELPACALTAAPGTEGCAAEVAELDSVNDPGSRTVTATVTAAGDDGGKRTRTVTADADADAAAVTDDDAPAATSGGTVYALMASDSSAQGDFTATSLAPSASWTAGGSSGGFSWSYPLRTVPTPGGLTPSVGLSYSSQATDGRTSATNNQGSWIGEGFSYEPGYIERRYKPCADDGHENSAEQCWAFDNATVMLAGAGGELIRDDTTGKWHLSSDNGARVEHLTGTVNGDNNGEHWKITTADGTEYYFGLGRLPGWTSGDEQTAATWTAPVHGDDPGEPCYSTTFGNAHCKQAWRWNLDYVKDPRGNAMAYYYAAETNHYAQHGDTSADGAAYHRGGYLKRIDHGLRHGSVYDTKAPARVVFHTAERCLPDAAFDCAPAKFTEANADHWPDVPFDRYCAAGGPCDISQTAQTFWTRKRLTGITTQMRSGTADYADVDKWTFTHLFTDNGDDTKTLWLSEIDHEGRAGGTLGLPSVQLQGIHLVNRVDSPDDNIDAFHRYRLATVLSETGAQLDITYAPTECTADALPQPGASTKRCYPVVWTPPGSIDPTTDWFHKYVVQEIIQTDRTGGGDDMVTRYDYQGDAGWRRTEPDGITDEEFLTWGQWQGYGRTTVTSGNGEVTDTRVDYTYLQGLHGDALPGGGTRSHTVTDSTGTTHTDHVEYTGFEIEARTWVDGQVSAKSLTTPWKHTTATRTEEWRTYRATTTKPREQRGHTRLADGSWRITKSSQTYDTATPTARLIRSEDLGDLAVSGDEQCTRLWYADNPARHIFELPRRSEAVSVDCSATPDRATDVIADERTFYDGGGYLDAPTAGNPTTTQRLSDHDGTTPTYQTTGTTTYDGFGRPLTQTDASGATTTRTYTQTHGLTTRTTSTNDLGHVTTTDYAPAWGAALGQTDPNGKRTDLAYDALGRLTSVWLPDRATTQTPSIKYSYDIRQNKPTVVKTERIENDGSYGVEYSLYDAMLRPRQAQSEGPDGTRMVADVFYDGSGRRKLVNATYNAQGPPGGELLLVNSGDVGAQTAFVHDGLGRVTDEIFQVSGEEQWRTSTAYDGDRTHVTPPQGGTATTSFTDARGRVTELRHHRGSGYDSTHYTYTPAGQPETVTDADGNVWRHEYDQLGRKVRTTDPDAGVSTTVYDAMDRPVFTTDARGETLSTVYDELGRPVSTWEGAPLTGTKLTETRYDRTGWLGHAWATLRFTGGGQYIATVVQSMDSLYRPLKTAYSIPSSEGALAGIYTFTTTYNRDGTVQGHGLPAAGGLPAESLVYGYDELQRPVSMTGSTSYITDTLYSPTGQLQQLEMSTGSGRTTWQTFFHEHGTERLTRSVVDIENITGPAGASHYSYDQAGNILAISDLPGGSGASPDLQCFAYDSRQRLAEAWTPAATANTAAGSGTVGATLGGALPSACDAAPGTGPLGGPSPYWTSWTVDAIGNRTQEIRHDTGLNAADDITRTYTYGENGAGPHAVTTVTENTPTGDRQYSYAYDDAGNTTARTIGGDTQTLDWDATGRLTRATEADGTETSYLYDAAGTRVLRRDATGTTLYLPGMELRQETGSTSVEGSRYYSFGGSTVALRTAADGVRFLASDHQGTAQLAIDPATGQTVQRRFTPYGGERGTPTGTWPGEKGFVGGTLDPSTGLTHLGAREYDPDLGKFLSVDPLIDYASPQQMNGYGYANNSPVTLSDPTGLLPWGGCITAQCVKDNGGYSTYDPGVADAEVKEDSAEEQVQLAETNLATAKQGVSDAVDELIDIAMEELGITAALDCFSTGDLAACGETALNIAGTFLGGLAGKLLAKYGAPWQWNKAYQLAKRVYGLVDKLWTSWDNIGKYTDALGLAEDALAAARAKVRNAKSKRDLDKDGCHSFLPGTAVLLADGSMVPIEDVELGDEVVVTDPETGETTTREVAGTIVTEDDKHFVNLTLTTDDASAGTAALISTTTHPFWVVSEQQWIEAGNLTPGMTLRTPDGDTVTLKSTHYFTQRHRTHDLTITGIHTYYVLASRTPVLVHNCGSRPDGPDPDGNIVYRALAENDDPAMGLTARAPGNAGVSPLSHVAGKKLTPWISTTKNPGIAFDKYNQGHGVVAIDLRRIPYSYVDISSGPFLSSRRHNAYARKDSEVLVWQNVPAEAIVGHWPGG
ncbi:RHS repeat-associated core domain-containing protein [Streptomyces aidingensis]|nr:RHS repeat-associated core domain-containing protein [Streptomyces aidingensis]